MSNHRADNQQPKINLIERVKPGGEGLSDFEVAAVVSDRDNYLAHNLRMVQALNAYGVQVDVGLEAIAFFRNFLESLGIITSEQKLAAEVLWENALNQQLKASLSLVRQQQLGGNGGGLIVPGGSVN